jgi:hypothetical protein
MSSEGAKIILGVMAAAYPGFQLTAQTIAIYSELLSDIDDETLARAAKRCMSKCKFYPTIAEIREEIAAEASSHLASAIDAWGEVRKAMCVFEYVYGGRPPKFSNAIIDRLVSSMGWGYLCHSESEVADRAHFMRAYDALAKTNRDEERLPSSLRLSSASDLDMLPSPKNEGVWDTGEREYQVNAWARETWRNEIIKQ